MTDTPKVNPLPERNSGTSASPEAVRGAVFNIQTYSIHDGPGIRTTVFMKACPLRCAWCQNPESQALQPQLFFIADNCAACGKCVATCPAKAVTLVAGKARTDRCLCLGDGKCVEVCPNDARSLMGRYMTAGEVFTEVARDAAFYRKSNGGVTLSGGEPLAQPDFAIALLQLCRQAGIHTAVETCGFASWETVCRVMEYVDLVLYDFKHMDPLEHKRYTGVTNELILENAKRIYHELHLPLLARVPVIPPFNDSVANIAAIARFIAVELSPTIKVHLLPYHGLGEAKYDRLEVVREQGTIRTPGVVQMNKLRQVVASFGLTAVIGG